MADGKRKMHLAVQAAAPGHPAGWRVPGGERTAGDDVAHYQNVARICEKAFLDILFLADSPSFTDDGRSPTRSLDPVVLITACALATEHLGSSPQGRDFAARVADIVFSIQTRFEDAVAYYADIKDRARFSSAMAHRDPTPTSVGRSWLLRSMLHRCLELNACRRRGKTLRFSTTSPE